LAKTPKDRQRIYRELFTNDIPDSEINSIRNITQKGGIFGKKEFIGEIAKLAKREIVLRSRGRPKKSL